MSDKAPPPRAAPWRVRASLVARYMSLADAEGSPRRPRSVSASRAVPTDPGLARGDPHGAYSGRAHAHAHAVQSAGESVQRNADHDEAGHQEGDPRWRYPAQLVRSVYAPAVQSGDANSAGGGRCDGARPRPRPLSHGNGRRGSRSEPAAGETYGVAVECRLVDGREERGACDESGEEYLT